MLYEHLWQGRGETPRSGGEHCMLCSRLWVHLETPQEAQIVFRQKSGMAIVFKKDNSGAVKGAWEGEGPVLIHTVHYNQTS